MTYFPPRFSAAHPKSVDTKSHISMKFNVPETVSCSNVGNTHVFLQHFWKVLIKNGSQNRRHFFTERFGGTMGVTLGGQGGHIGDKGMGGGERGVYLGGGKVKIEKQKRPGSFPAAYSTIWTILWGKLNLNPIPTR